MKKIIAALLAALTLLTLFSCKKAEESTTEGAGGKTVTCSISYPTLLEDGGIQMSAGMQEYPRGTMEQALKEGLNGKIEATFDDQGNINSIGKLEAKNGNRFVIITIASNGQPTEIDKKPADITLEDFASYEICYANANGEYLTYIE